MHVDDLILVSIDDHVVEPPDMFLNHVPAKYKAEAPVVVTDDEGVDQWMYQGRPQGVSGLNAVVSWPAEEWGRDPAGFAEMRPGVYDVHERVREITAGKGVDAVVDTTSAPASAMVPLAIDLVKRKAGRIIVQSLGGTISAFPIEKLARKYITLKPARGHSYASVELAIQRIASGKYPLERLATHTFGLSDVDLAIRSVGGSGAPGAIHVTVLPWQRES